MPFPGISRSRALRRWKAERDVRRARLTLLRLLPRISKPLTAGVCAGIVIQALANVAFIVATGVMLGAVPGAVRAGLDSSAGHRLIGGLVAVALLFVGLRAHEPVQDMLVMSLGRRTDGALRVRLMRAMLRPTGVAHLEDAALQDLVRDAQGVGVLDGITPWDAVRGMTGNATRRLSQIGAAVIVARFRWWLALVMVAHGLLVRYVIVADQLRAAGARLGNTQAMRRSDYYRTLAISPGAAKETRVFGLGAWVLGRFREHWTAGMSLLWRERKEQGTSPWTWSVSWGAITFASMFLVGRAAVRGEIDLQTLAMTASAAMSAGSIWLSQNDIWVAHGAATVPAVLDVERATARPELAQGGDADPAGAPVREISFERVGFRYPGRDRDVIRDLDLVIPAGRSLAIVGPNGAGKTTLVKLLARLYDPSAGRIAADGRDVREFRPEAWQRRIAAIFQDFVRYELPAVANVGFGAVERMGDREALDSVAARVGALEFVEALPGGWETVLSRQFSGGAELSGGQWQRVALARALFAVHGGAGVLVLDEPTANLDVRAEAELFDRFLDLTRGVTTVLISHRFSTVRHADRICVLDEGRIVEQGTHAELMAASGRYARMFTLQAARFLDEPEPAGA